jgi:hypothetical protein
VFSVTRRLFLLLLLIHLAYQAAALLVVVCTEVSIDLIAVSVVAVVHFVRFLTFCCCPPLVDSHYNCQHCSFFGSSPSVDKTIEVVSDTSLSSAYLE